VDLHPVVDPVRDLGNFIREQRLAAQISVRALAEKAGVSNPYLSQVERGLRRPSAEILAQIARALSMSVETLLSMAGILDSPEPAPPVLAAIRADPALSERQKAALIEIYSAFRGEDDGRRDAVDEADGTGGDDEADGTGGDGAAAQPRPA
jgi:transcriptional regulator with XRE-family HTH domain